MATFYILTALNTIMLLAVIFVDSKLIPANKDKNVYDDVKPGLAAIILASLFLRIPGYTLSDIIALLLALVPVMVAGGLITILIYVLLRRVFDWG